MKSSLARRLFRTLFGIGLMNVLLTLVAVEFIYEDIEDTILRLELAEERRFIEERIVEPRTQTWRTALLLAWYVPDGAAPADLPAMFADRAPPFSAEVDIGEKTYLISIERTRAPSGILYLSQDITLLEAREDALQIGIAALAAGGMLLLGMLLARLGTHRIVAPLRDLSRHIGELRPDAPGARIGARYRDAELAGIAATIDELLDALEAYVKREKALVSLASHELRTPVAVIAGALDVLEARNSLNESDRLTVARIRRAAEAMRTDVEALLKLARRASDADAGEQVDLAEAIRAALAELGYGADVASDRIACRCIDPPPHVDAEPALVRMLLRNLLQNAIRHTPGAIRIELGADTLSIADTGPGLPVHIRERLIERGGSEIPVDGLGLFIVRLICERFGWTLEAKTGKLGGAELVLHFASPPGASAD